MDEFEELEMEFATNNRNDALPGSLVPEEKLQILSLR